MSVREYMLKMYTEWRNDFLTYRGFAEHHGLTDEEAEQLIQLARIISEHPHPEE